MEFNERLLNLAKMFVTRGTIFYVEYKTLKFGNPIKNWHYAINRNKPHHQIDRYKLLPATSRKPLNEKMKYFLVKAGTKDFLEGDSYFLKLPRYLKLEDLLDSKKSVIKGVLPEEI